MPSGRQGGVKCKLHKTFLYPQFVLPISWRCHHPRHLCRTLTLVLLISDQVADGLAALRNGTRHLNEAEHPVQDVAVEELVGPTQRPDQLGARHEPCTTKRTFVSKLDAPPTTRQASTNERVAHDYSTFTYNPHTFNTHTIFMGSTNNLKSAVDVDFWYILWDRLNICSPASLLNTQRLKSLFQLLCTHE